jgi:hypothetical protein
VFGRSLQMSKLLHCQKFNSRKILGVDSVEGSLAVIGNARLRVVSQKVESDFIKKLLLRETRAVLT